MSRLISSWPVQLRDAATAGDPVHDDGADEIRPSPAEATRQTRDAAVLRLLWRLPSCQPWAAQRCSPRATQRSATPTRWLLWRAVIGMTVPCQVRITARLYNQPELHDASHDKAANRWALFESSVGL